MNLATWFRQTVTCAAPSGARDSAGDPAFSAQRSIRCRVEAMDQTVKIEDGREARTTHVVYTDQPITIGERIWLPGANTADVDEAREVLSVGSTNDKMQTRTLYKVLVSGMVFR